MMVSVLQYLRKLEMMSLEEKVLTRMQLASKLGLSPWSIWRWTKEGKMPHIRIDKRIFYRVDTIQRWLTDAEKASIKEISQERDAGIRPVQKNAYSHI